MSCQPFPKNNNENDNSSGSYEEQFIFFVIPLYFVPVAFEQITKTDENTIPDGNAEEGIAKKLAVWLFHAAGNEGNVGAAQGNDSSKADSQGTVLLHFFLRGSNALHCFRKTVFQKGEDSCTADSADKIAERGAGKTCQNTARNQQKKRNIIGFGKGTAERQYDFAGNGETSVFQ